jgi:hypothetical protein
MKRLARAVACALVTAVALSGCIRYNVDMTLSQDNTASGTIVIAVQKGVGHEMGLASDQAALTQLFGESPFGPNFTPKDYADGNWVGKSYTFSGVEITNLADLAPLFAVTRDGDIFSVNGAGAPLTEDQKKELPSGAESSVAITFPGPVIESNGTVKGNTATWNPFTMTGPIHATAKATGADAGSSFPTWILIAGGAALVILLGAAVVVVVLVRRRRNPAAPSIPEPIDWDIPTAPPSAEGPEPSAGEELVGEAPVPPPPVVEESAPAPTPPVAAPKKRAPSTAKPKATPAPVDAESDGEE